MAAASSARSTSELGFEISEIRSLLDLSDQPERDCAEADRIATGHLAAVESKIVRLEALRTELARMVGVCRGGQVATCRVMEAFADHSLCQTDHANGAQLAEASPTDARHKRSRNNIYDGKVA